ncbi:MAG: hypothetical protein K1X75_16445 [Leptospirales bacterium]|nr:hypothetical protein [Leptospirales bacterium]
MNLWLRAAAAAVFVWLAACTNFSAEDNIINTPILMSITREGSGHLIQVQAQNAELGFIGYRLFTGASATAAQAASSGVDCGALNLLTTTAGIRYIEAKPGQSSVTAGTTDRICAAPLTINAGDYVVMRATVFDLAAIAQSNASNALQAP